MPGGVLSPHVDNPNNELSLTLQISLRGAAAAWPLHFVRKRGDGAPQMVAGDGSDPGTVDVALDDNGAVLYYGLEVIHWRARQATTTLTQLILAWREVDERRCHNQ